VSRTSNARSEGLRAADTQARILAQREFATPVVVEAGAGTGKTTALVARVLAWSLGPGWARARARAESSADIRDDRIAEHVLRRVVAITFTEKAAAEMSERIGFALGALERGEPLAWLAPPEPPLEIDELCVRARALRGSLDHLVVQTIHAYCRRLLVENSLDAQLHPNLEIDADGRLQEQAIRSAMEAQLETAYRDPGAPDFLALAARGFGPREIEQALIALSEAGLPAEALRADPATPDRIAALVARLRASLDDFAAIASETLSSVRGVAAETSELLDQLRARLIEAPPAGRAELAEFVGVLRERLTDSHRTRLQAWRRGAFNKGETSALGDRADPLRMRVGELLPALDHFSSIDLELLDAARRALAAPLGAAEAQLRSAGVLTFSALLAEVRRLLRTRPEVAARIRSGIDQLLVDEFQDTDPCQCEIVRALALDGAEGSRPGLFIVGDPKQSIYGWRRADLAAYRAFVDEVCESGGRRVSLSVNFRSVPAVLDEVERVVAPVMEEVPGVQPAFEPLVASAEHAEAEGFSGGRLRCVEYWLPAEWDEGSGVRETSVSEAAQIEASALARELRELHDQHAVAWGSIAVLFRSRSDWETYLPALRQAGIPYAAEGDRSYYRRREIIDAACLVRCAIEPNDQLAWISYLRSAAVGVPDAAWIPLWSRGFPDRLAQLDAEDPAAIAELVTSIREAASAVSADVPGIERIAGWEENLISAVVDIAHLRVSLASDPADVFVEKLRARTLFEVTESARYLGAWRCANLERFFGEVRQELESGRDPHDLARALRSAVAAERVAEEGRPPDLMSDAVRVMTIHAAKGLGFEHVYLMQLHKGAGGGPDRPTQAVELADGFEYQLLGLPTLAWDRAQRDRARSAEAERVRLLYVAMTRAAQRLVLTGLWADHQQRSRSGQAIEHVRPRIESTEGLDAWLSETASEACAEFVDGFGARWSLPALVPPGDPATATIRAHEPALPSASEVEDDSRRLADLRASAAARMARPTRATASAPSSEEGESGDGDRERVEPLRRAKSGVDARAIGVAIHRALEEFDFAADASRETKRLRDGIARELAQAAAVDDADPTITAADPTVAAGTALWDAIARGQLFARLRALADRIVARELPVLSPPERESGPVGFRAGVIDLVYRDPSDDQLVVVDYKTGEATDPEALQRRADSYAEQGAFYSRALEDAFELGYAPRCEFWFLDADVCL